MILSSLLIWAFAGSSAWATAPAPVDLVEMFVDRSLKAHGLELDPDPSGKVIEAFVIDTYPVFVPEEKLFYWANRLHWMTKERAVREELLIKEGETWNENLARESARNLRKNLIFTFSQIVACRGSEPGKVKALVVSRDFWSLRVSYDLSFIDGRLEYLYLGIFEKNLRGYAESGSPFVLEYDLASLRFFQQYVNPRVRWTRINFTEEGGPVFNHQTRKFEGARGFLSVSQPLYSLGTKWGWGVEADADARVKRTFSMGKIARTTIFDTGESLPIQYQSAVLKTRVWGTRSWGHAWKHNLTFAWRLNIPYYEFRGLDGESYLPLSLNRFVERSLPFRDRFGRVEFVYEFFQPQFAQLMNLDTYAIIEDFRIGPYLTATAGVAAPVFGMESIHVQPSLTAGYRGIWRKDGVLNLEFTASARRQFAPVVIEGPWINRLLSFSGRQAFPSWGFGRFVLGGRFAWRLKDLTRTIDTVGGDSTLRGFPSGYFYGPSTWSSNLEFRTRSWRVTQYALVGVVGFVDVGDAFGDGDPLELHASTGAGLRILFPQVNRQILRIDVGFPIAEKLWPSLALEFEQAF